jgi:hypothetical protein
MQMDLVGVEGRYRAMSPEEFGTVKRSDLTADAASIYDREVTRRLSLGYRSSDSDVPLLVKRKPRWGLRAFFIVVGLFILLSVLGKVTDRPSLHGDKFNADVMCESFVKDRLRAPATAKFSPFEETTISELGDDRWRVAGYVDSQNGFGALIRDRYSCTVRYEGENKWRGESVTVTDR